MKYLAFLIVLCPAFVYSQKLQLINVDNVKNLPLGQGLQLELRLAVDEFKINRTTCEVMTEPKLENKFIIIPKSEGPLTIGPIRAGNLISNTITINVVASVMNSNIFITAPDSSIVGDEIKLVLTNLSASDAYTIKDLKMKPAKEYEIVGESFSMSASESKGEKMKKETLVILIKPLIEGDLVIDQNSFSSENIKKIALEGKTLKVFKVMK